MADRLPSLREDGISRAYDGGDHVELYAADNYGDSPERLDAAEVRELRDWLSAWLAREDTD